MNCKSRMPSSDLTTLLGISHAGYPLGKCPMGIESLLVLGTGFAYSKRTSTTTMRWSEAVESNTRASTGFSPRIQT